jgi:hypothetical protein
MPGGHVTAHHGPVKLHVHPILRELRALYDVGERNTLDRYRAYKRLMVDGPELLPLGDFSPMGQRQPEYLDALIEMNAEAVAAACAREIEAELVDSPAEFRLMLVVADQPRNGWTQRWLTDAAWRFGPEQRPGPSPDRRGITARGWTAGERWVTVQVWTHVTPTFMYLRSQLRCAAVRAIWRGQHGGPVTLADMMAQEGAALRFGGGLFAGAPLALAADELDYTREVLAPYRHSDHWPSCFAALYGDEAAREVGFPPLGLSALAGLGVALHEEAARTQPL